jgi:hypothetical protein
MKTFLHAVALLLFFLLSHAAGQDKAPQEKAKDKPKTGAAAYDGFPEPLRSQLVKEWQQELEALKRTIKDHQERFRRAKTLTERQHLQRPITEYKAKLAKHERNEPPYFTKERARALGDAPPEDKELPGLSVTQLTVGQSYLIDGGVRDRGVFGNTWAKIIQIIDDDNMLVGIDNGAGSPGGNPRYSVIVWCKFSTKGLTDDKTGFLAGILGADKVTVTGTTRYKTASGGTRTIFVLEPHGKEKK